jgi:hypothetical protein
LEKRKQNKIGKMRNVKRLVFIGGMVLDPALDHLAGKAATATQIWVL